MPVYDIKDPLPRITEPEKVKERATEPVLAVNPVTRVRTLRQQWPRRRARKYAADQAEPDMPLAEKSVRSLIDRVNQDMEAHGVKIHLVLKQEKEGYVLDIYDCSTENLCSIIGDIEITLEELPQLICNLQEEVGLLIDTVS